MVKYVGKQELDNIGSAGTATTECRGSLFCIVARLLGH